MSDRRSQKSALHSNLLSIQQFCHCARTPISSKVSTSTKIRGLVMLEVYQFACLQDNYGFLVHDPDTGATAAVDTPEVAPINQALAEKGWRLTHILNTHHHFDHAGGNEELKAQWDCQVVGAAADAQRIPGIDVTVADGDTLMLGSPCPNHGGSRSYVWACCLLFCRGWGGLRWGYPICTRLRTIV